MGYLVLSMACSALISIIMRLSEGKIKSRLGMLAGNYFTCMIMAMCFMGFKNMFPAEKGMGAALGLGAINGAFYISTLIALQFCIHRYGVVLPSIFTRMGTMLVPLVVSIFLFREIPSRWQWIGFGMCIAGILIMNHHKNGEKSSVSIFLLLLLLAEGGCSVMAKVYKELGRDVFSGQFLFFTFTSALLICCVLMLARRERPGANELLYGAMIGVPNYLCSFFVLKSLETLDAFIVYPSRSVGTIAMVALVGMIAFKERLRRQQLIALPVILAALILLNF